MAFPIPQVTAAGRALLTKVMDGEALEFTRFKMGDGYLSDFIADNLINLIHTVTTVDVNKILRAKDYVSIRGIFTNQDITDGFYWREFGLFANDPDTGEILFAYSNAGDRAEYISPPETQEIVRNLVASVSLNNASSITLIASDSMAFATLEDLAKINDVIPLTHTVDSGIHIFTGLTREGLVPIQFAATADYTAGQTITIDSVRYTVALSSGDTPDGIVWKAGTKQLGLCDSTNQTLIIIQSPDNVPAHNVDPESHPDIRAMLSNHEGRITRLENILLSDITGNPFLITFENLDGLVVTGTWNQAQARMEF